MERKEKNVNEIESMIFYKSFFETKYEKTAEIFCVKRYLFTAKNVKNMKNPEKPEINAFLLCEIRFFNVSCLVGYNYLTFKQKCSIIGNASDNI